ncbi:hypothetical protein O6H91_19G038100 [Diphasiastrum complanatum]|uniref:Uncharacterized protein n=1 Tax=Diphasiastrum complanatum TaxID=34168 RepID=A0ACC2AU95_DIPCM|nr:hypothetical protein O6H91_19G038100 [Diphasiastrum complanatum]
MYDFCFTYPYGVVVLVGGVVGYSKKGSVTSLAGGVGAGLLLILAGHLSLNAYNKGQKSYLAMFLQTGISIALTVVMSLRYQHTAKFMPAGLVAALSGFMTLFYLYKLATNGNHIRKKTG